MNDLFETSDLPLAATLIAHGATLECVDRTRGSRAFFCFQRERGLDAIVQAFWTHEIKVEPLRFFNALKEAKTRLYEESIAYGD